MISEYRALEALRRGETIDIEGIKLKMADGDLCVGDLYVAERNTGPKLLTVKSFGRDCVFPTCSAYAFDIWECVKVCEAD
ncbi:MAG: hypothetical protein Q8P07_04085 [bacterium]|nr:hypothetical protein [bacterium]